MTPLRVLAGASVAVAAVLGGTGCTASEEETTSAADRSAVSAPLPAAPPTPAGAAEARVLAELPEGTASGTAVLAYAGVGELRAPFTGSCSRVDDGLRLEGTADTAQIRLEASPAGVRLALDDLGFAATSDLTTGRYDVSDGHLSLVADLAQEGQAVGSVELEVDCGS